MSDDEHSPTESEAAAPSTDGRARLVDALKKPRSRGQIVAAVLLAVLGFAAVTQVQANDKDDRYVGARQGDLVQFINNLSLATQRAESEIAALEEARDSLRNDTEARTTALELARKQADTLGILAGTVPTTGPGLRITVTDPGGGVGTNQLLNGIEELRDAGAEAIEINDEVRVIAQTSLQDTADGVLVDGQLLKAPYVIDVIGDPVTLAPALDFRGGFTFEVREVNGKVDVEKSDEIDILSVHEPITPEYAEPGSAG